MGGIMGGGGKGGKNGGPTPPDFNAAAQTQSATSRNNVNGPFGSASWTQGPDGRWTENMSMSPGLQGATDNLMGQIGSGSHLSPQEQRDQAISGAYGMQTSRLDPQFAQREEQTRAQLAAQGIDPGSEAYQNEMGNFNRSRNDAYQQALLGAQSGAGNTAYAQSLAGNMQPYQQLGMLSGLGQQAGLASLSQAQPVNALNAASQMYGGQLQNYGIQQQGKNGSLGGLMSLGGTLGAASILA